MRAEDVPVAERLSDEGFYQLDLSTQRADRPAPERRTAEHSAAWERRTQHFLDTDPGGCWVAEDDTGMLGFATSVRRELMWCLATYVVRPGLQGQGIGRPLLQAALHHGRGCLRGMLSSSSDPRAVRRYRAAGFDLHPQMFLVGEVDRSAIPVVEKVREGSVGERVLRRAEWAVLIVPWDAPSGRRDQKMSSESSAQSRRAPGAPAHSNRA